MRLDRRAKEPGKELQGTLGRRFKLKRGPCGFGEEDTRKRSRKSSRKDRRAAKQPVRCRKTSWECRAGRCIPRRLGSPVFALTLSPAFLMLLLGLRPPPSTYSCTFGTLQEKETGLTLRTTIATLQRVRRGQAQYAEEV